MRRKSTAPLLLSAKGIRLMIANLCLLLAPALASSTTFQDPQPAPPPQEEPKPVQQETPPPPEPEPKQEPQPEPKPEPKEEPRPEPVRASSEVPASTSKLNYTYWQFDVVRGDGNGYIRGPDGFDVHGSYALPQQPGLFVFGGFSHLSGSTGFESPDTNNLTVGAGLHTAVNPMTEIGRASCRE